MPLPPGPRRPSVVQLAQWTLRPLPLLDECARRFGDIFTLRFPGFGDMVMVHSPELIKQVFTGSPEVLLAGKANAILGPLLGSSSVLLLDRAEHLRQRRLLMPSFHGERMTTYVEQMRDLTERSLSRWPVGSPFALYPRMQGITLDVILRAVFGLDEGAAMSGFASRLEELFEPPPPAVLFVPGFANEEWWNPYRRFAKRFHAMRDGIDKEIFALLAERRRDAALASRTDVLSLLLSARDEDGAPMTDLELRDELITMIAAGHETTANSVSWAFERVLALPEVAAKVFAELGEVMGDGRLDPLQLHRLTYLDAVIKETLRLRPILPIVVRSLAAPFTVGGYTLPEGAAVAPCIYLTHRRPDLYPDPERFSPERFLGSKKADPYEWLPFGGGVRRCIGMAFALVEMKVILATVLAKARLRLVGAPVRVVRRGITLVPSDGTQVVMAA